MTTAVHAVAWATQADTAPPVELRWVVADDLAAAVSHDHHDRGALDPRATAERLRALMDGGTILPVRSGTSLADDDEVREWLAHRRTSLAEALHRLTDAVELGIRVADPVDESPDASAGPGASYIHRRLAERHAARELAARLAPLADVAREGPVPTGDRHPPGAAFLVPRDGIERFVARLAELDRGAAAPGLVCTGPWPPYSFTGATD